MKKFLRKFLLNLLLPELERRHWFSIGSGFERRICSLEENQNMIMNNLRIGIDMERSGSWESERSIRSALIVIYRRPNGQEEIVQSFCIESTRIEKDILPILRNFERTNKRENVFLDEPYPGFFRNAKF